MNVEEILIRELRKMGADGLYNPEGPCGCGIGNEDFVTCGCCETMLECVPAKRGKGGLYYPIEDKQEKRKKQIKSIVEDFCISRRDLEYTGKEEAYHIICQLENPPVPDGEVSFRGVVGIVSIGTETGSVKSELRRISLEYIHELKKRLEEGL